MTLESYIAWEEVDLGNTSQSYGLQSTFVESQNSIEK